MEQKEPSMEEILSSIRRILSNEEVSDSVKETSEKDLVNGSYVSSKVVELTEDMMIQKQEEKSRNKKEEKSDNLISEPTEKAAVDSFSELTKVIEQEKKTRTF